MWLCVYVYAIKSSITETRREVGMQRESKVHLSRALLKMRPSGFSPPNQAHFPSLGEFSDGPVESQVRSLPEWCRT